MSDLDTASAAQRLGVAATAVLGWCKAGLIQGAHRNPAGQFRIDPASLDSIDPAMVAAAREALHDQRDRMRRRSAPPPPPPPPDAATELAAGAGDHQQLGSAAAGVHLQPTPAASPSSPPAAEDATPPPRPPVPAPAAVDDSDLDLRALLGRAVVLSFVPLQSEAPVELRLRRLAVVAQSLDLRLTAVRLEPAAEAAA